MLFLLQTCVLHKPKISVETQCRALPISMAFVRCPFLCLLNYYFACNEHTCEVTHPFLSLWRCAIYSDMKSLSVILLGGLFASPLKPEISLLTVLIQSVD